MARAGLAIHAEMTPRRVLPPPAPTAPPKAILLGINESTILDGEDPTNNFIDLLNYTTLRSRDDSMTLAPFAMTVHAIDCLFRVVDEGTVNSITLTLYVNGAPTGLTTTVTEGGHGLVELDVPINEFDDLEWYVEFDEPVPGESVATFATVLVYSSESNERLGLFYEARAQSVSFGDPWHRWASLLGAKHSNSLGVEANGIGAVPYDIEITAMNMWVPPYPSNAPQLDTRTLSLRQNGADVGTAVAALPSVFDTEVESVQFPAVTPLNATTTGRVGVALTVSDTESPRTSVVDKLMAAIAYRAVNEADENACILESSWFISSTNGYLNLAPQIDSFTSGVQAQAEIPWPVKGTLRNFRLTWPEAPSGTWQVDLLVNGIVVDTLTSSGTTVLSSAETPVEVGDLVVYHLQRTAGSGSFRGLVLIAFDPDIS